MYERQDNTTGMLVTSTAAADVVAVDDAVSGDRRSRRRRFDFVLKLLIGIQSRYEVLSRILVSPIRGTTWVL